MSTPVERPQRNRVRQPAPVEPEPTQEVAVQEEQPAMEVLPPSPQKGGNSDSRSWLIAMGIFALTMLAMEWLKR